MNDVIVGAEQKDDQGLGNGGKLPCMPFISNSWSWFVLRHEKNGNGKRTFLVNFCRKIKIQNPRGPKKKANAIWIRRPSITAKTSSMYIICNSSPAFNSMRKDNHETQTMTF